VLLEGWCDSKPGNSSNKAFCLGAGKVFWGSGYSWLHLHSWKGWHLTKLIVWLPRETIRKTCPAVFRRYPKTTCILDCAETLMQKSSNLQSRGESSSNYKSHNTSKYCVAIDPCVFLFFSFSFSILKFFIFYLQRHKKKRRSNASNITTYI
jgi:hypothetical protein